MQALFKRLNAPDELASHTSFLKTKRLRF